jgi:periplasmic divalent cation tolerance protein
MYFFGAGDGESMPTDAVVILSTAPPGEAAGIARALVEDRLAACVQLAGIRSFYRWQGRVEDEPEELMLIKTRRPLADAAIARVRELHSYEVPEAVVLSVDAGSADYLAWLAAETGRAP